MDNTDPNNPNQNPPSDAFPPSTVTPPSNPWDPPANPTSIPDASTIPQTDPISASTVQPASEPAGINVWPAPPQTTPAPENPLSQPALAPSQPDINITTGGNPEPANPTLSNPYLQPQDSTQPIAPQSVAPAPTDPAIFPQPQGNAPIGITQFGSGQSFTQNDTPAPSPALENPFGQPAPQTPQQDPLNTAFAPHPNPNQPSPFSAPETPAAPPEQPSQIPTQPGGQALNTDAPIIDHAENPIPGLTPVNPTSPTPADPMNPNPAPSSDNPQIPGTNQSGTLDLSQLQNTNPTSEGLPAPETPAQPARATPLPERGPVENAPTDLSHLIAGDEQHQQPGDIYTPPVASDQSPSLNTTQPQSAPENGTPPPGKHLNLTKVLLVAGIPIILIVAAISAYMILGIGKTAPQSETNATATEQTDTQAPLTNPPQLIEAPAPKETPTPVPSPKVVENATSGTTLPAASSSPMSAIEQLKARQAASSSPSASSIP